MMPSGTQQLRAKDRDLVSWLTALTCWSGREGRLSGDNPPSPVLLHHLWTLLFLQPFDEFVESGCEGQQSPITL